MANKTYYWFSELRMHKDLFIAVFQGRRYFSECGYKHRMGRIVSIRPEAVHSELIITMFRAGK